MSHATSLRRAVRFGVVTALYFSGLLWLLASIRLRRRIAVLTYHRVLPLSKQARSFSAPGIVVTPETFDRHMRFLRRHFNAIDVSTFAELLRTGTPIRPRTCLVTFDDGWRDNLDHALPVIRRHQVPAVLFVATDFIGTDRCFWQERLSRLLYEARCRPEIISLFTECGLSDIVHATPERARTLIRVFVDRLKTQPPEAVDRVFALLAPLSTSGQDLEIDRFLSWEELEQLSRDRCFAVAPHGHSHSPLTQLSGDAVKAELVNSREAIRSRLGLTSNVIAYPNGDANAEVATIAREQGYVIGFTTRRGLVSATDDPLLLPRINVHEGCASDEAAFLYNMLGLP